MEDRRRAVELVQEAVDSGARRVAACRVVGISMRTLQRWEADGVREDQRRGPNSEPANALSEPERELVAAVATSPTFRDLPPSQIVPILADSEVYVASEATFYRILRDKRLMAHRGRARPRTHRRPRQFVANGPNQVWCWDITYLRSAVRGSFHYLYLAVDLWSRKIVGWRVESQETGEVAAQMIEEAASREEVEGNQLVVHSDNGGPMKGATLLATLQWLGIVPSFSRPHVSDDNAYAEALFRTLKYRPEYPSVPFRSVEDARAWVQGFVRWYNEEHRHSGIQFVTPSQRHGGEHVKILRTREEVYEEAKSKRPDRWTGRVRNWSPVAEVVLNPLPTQVGSTEAERSA